jgi:hypothetical protein
MSEFDQRPRHQDEAASAAPSSSEEGPTFGGVAETMASGFENAESAMDFMSGHDHFASGVKTFAGLDSGLLSLVASAGDAYEGVHDMQEGKTAKGAGEMTKAGASAVGDVANAYHAAAEGFAKYGASEEGKEIFEHQAKKADFVHSSAAGAGDIVGGVMDISDGYDHYKHGKNIDEKAGGLDTEGQGIAETGSGVAEVATGLTGTESLGLAGNVIRTIAPAAGEISLGGLASVAGPALGSFATGMQIGHYGDEEAKKLGVFHDAKGNAESASDWASDKGMAADQWVTQHLHSKGLGTAAGLATTGLSSIVGGLAAGESAVAGAELAVGHAARRLWDWL